MPGGCDVEAQVAVAAISGLLLISVRACLGLHLRPKLVFSIRFKRLMSATGRHRGVA